jgi:NAD-dependent dihydropyrimidine dehydrogenase PreA subunit
MANHPECKQRPGAFVPVIDRNRCEGKGDCERVCPVGVFALGALPKSMRAGLGVKGRIKGIVHRWQQAILVHSELCKACSLCVSACPEKAINLARSAAAK